MCGIIIKYDSLANQYNFVKIYIVFEEFSKQVILYNVKFQLVTYITYNVYSTEETFFLVFLEILNQFSKNLKEMIPQ